MKSFFFDWDGTLVDSLPLLFAAHNHVRGMMGHTPWTKEEYLQQALSTTRDLYNRIYGERAPEVETMAYQFISEHEKELVQIIPGAENLLDFLYSREIPMGIVSNKLHSRLLDDVKSFKWSKYFGVVVGAGYAERDKPSAAPLFRALKEHPQELDVRNVLFVGDMETDLACAQAAGCDCAFLTHTARAQELADKYKPRYVVGDLRELKKAAMDFLAN